ncbi:MAG: MmpS family transport accessory protein [Mycobacterium sp.]|uniref:MmpS family transport accessory protein n=1 Tax=Mycobacterium sp. TaxID=1785 RepID=UPI002614098F|nr:MmpS family transport accessory protein [Mycobacterium sp.]MDI3315598.1 MmpS family transport accessory protein [Mycobacterium sp.]
MTDRRRPKAFGRVGRRAGATEGATERFRRWSPPHPGPAHVGRPPYWSADPPGYPSAPGRSPVESDPTDRLAPQWWRSQVPAETAPETITPPQGPKSPRWLWLLAGAAVLLVVALLIALVISTDSARKQTAVAPLPAMPHPTSTTSPPLTTGSPSATATAPTTSPPQTTGSPPMQSVVYTVTGEGRAISITYVDNDGVRQTEFNVALPWSKEVSLSSQNTASVTIINIGHDVTCSVTVAGTQVRRHTGVGLTVCNAG